MPRRRVPSTSLPRRLDRRRPGGNATGAQHRPPRGPRGQVEAIAERRVIALRLRCGGASYRKIAKVTGVDVATAYADVRAELADLRQQTVEEARELRDLELQRFDEMTAGLWPQVRAGSPPHVTAAVRVSERRARLLGLDAPVVTKSELTGALSVTAERLAAERELFGKLSVEQLEVLAADSQALVDRAMAMVKANALTPVAATALRTAVEYDEGGDVRRPEFAGADVARSGDGDRPFDTERAPARTTPMLVAVSLLRGAGAEVDDVATGGPTEPITSSNVDDR